MPKSGHHKTCLRFHTPSASPHFCSSELRILDDCLDKSKDLMLILDRKGEQQLEMNHLHIRNRRPTFSITFDIIITRPTFHRA